MSKKSIVDAKEFSQALDQVSKVLRKSAIPALSEVLVRFSGDCCILTATDINTWLIKKIPAWGVDFAFVFRRTKDVAKACRLFDGPLTLELSETGEDRNRTLTLYMRCGNRAGEFEAMAPEDYPDNTPFEAEVSFTANAAALLKRVERVGYAAVKPTSDSLPSAASIQFSGSRVFALDGRRLACDTDRNLSVPRPFMTYGESLSHLKIFGDRDVTFALGKKRGSVTDGMATVDFRITGDTVYNVDDAIPKESGETLFVSPQDFLKELKYLKEFTANERSPYVRFCGGELVMPTATGKFRTSVAVSGESNVTFAFDLRYMLDAMLQFKNERHIALKIKSATFPVMIQAEERSDFALVCPVRLSDRLLAA